MTTITVLRDEYPGDVAWHRFVDFHRPKWQNRKDKHIYISALGGEDFAIVLATTMGQLSLKWFDENIGALDGRSASDVLQNEPAGRTIIKTLLMRMPG